MKTWAVRMKRRQGMNAGHNQTARIEYVEANTANEAQRIAEKRQPNYITVTVRTP